MLSAFFISYPPLIRTAIIADWLVTYGGAEHVLSELQALYPDAPFFTTVSRSERLGPLKNATIHTTSLQSIYRVIRNHQVLLPLMPRAIENIDLTGFDMVISSSHAVAKGVIPPPRTLHVCYCHTPMRYAWEMEDEYLNDFHIPKLLRRSVKKQLSKIRRWDLTTAQRVDVFIANSTTTQERIKRIYGRDSVVIPPPVNEKFFATHSSLPTTPYYLAVGRMVPYKRFDLLIEVANELKLPLKIAGRGQDEARLRKLAGPTVEFLGFVPDADLPSLYANADALLFPQYEDAGIVLLEAQATGTPAIAFRAGGAIDAIEENKTGIFFDAQTKESVREAIERFQKQHWDKNHIREEAKKFSQKEFKQKFSEVIAENYEKFRNGNFRKNS